MGAVLAVEDETGVGGGDENSGPEIEYGRVNLGEVVEASEGDVAGGERGRRADIGDAGGSGVAPVRSGEAERLFGVDGGVGVGWRMWVEVGISEAVVHGFDAGGAAIGEVGDLDGSGALGER